MAATFSQWTVNNPPPGGWTPRTAADARLTFFRKLNSEGVTVSAVAEHDPFSLEDHYVITSCSEDSALTCAVKECGATLDLSEEKGFDPTLKWKPRNAHGASAPLFSLTHTKSNGETEYAVVTEASVWRPRARDTDAAPTVESGGVQDEAHSEPDGGRDGPAYDLDAMHDDWLADGGTAEEIDLFLRQLAERMGDGSTVADEEWTEETGNVQGSTWDFTGTCVDPRLLGPN